MQSLKEIISYNNSCCFVLSQAGLIKFNNKNFKKNDFVNDLDSTNFIKKIKQKKIFIHQKDTEKTFLQSLKTLQNCLLKDELIYITINPINLNKAGFGKFYSEWLDTTVKTLTGLEFGKRATTKKEQENSIFFNIGLWTDSWQVYEKINLANPNNQIKFYKNEKFNTNFATLKLNKSEFIDYFSGVDTVKIIKEQDENNFILFGTNQIKIPIISLFKHVFIASKTGEGKSQLLLYLISLLKDKGANFLLLDPKMSTALKAQKIFNEPHKEGVKFNPLALKIKKEFVATYSNSLLDLLVKEDTTYLKLYIGYLLQTAVLHNQEQTKEEDFLNFQDLYEIMMKNPQSSKFIKLASYEPFKALLDLIMSKGSLKHNEMAWVASTARIKALADNLDLGGKSLGLDFDQNNFIGMPKINMTALNGTNDLSLQLIVLTFWFDILNKSKDRKGKKTFLVIEEASTVNIPFFARMIATIREENVSIILVTQYANQLISEIKDSIIDNISTYFCGKTGENNAKFMARAMGMRAEELEEINDGSYEFWLKSDNLRIKTKAEHVSVSVD